jgi:hypothetical protein
MYQEQFERGEINEAQYKTLVSAKSRYDTMDSVPAPVPYLGANNFFDETQFVPETFLPDPAAELSAEDKIYLAMKWGTLYKPAEWIELERNYDEMMKSFDI